MGFFLFCLFLLLIVYTYAGYPLLLVAWARLFPRPIKTGQTEGWPAVTVLMAARNEEGRIGKRIENLLEQEYPKDKLGLVIVSDGSIDGTNAIIKEFESTLGPRVKGVYLSRAAGKSSALNKGSTLVSGDIIVFADARQTFDAHAIRHLVTNFADPEVGCVSGELVFFKDTQSSIEQEMGLYWKLEKMIRKTESRIHSSAGATGAIYALRRPLFQEIPPGALLDDVLIPMRSVQQGYRTIFEPKARAFDQVSRDARQEWRRKVRTLAGNWQLFSLAPDLFLPWRNPIWFRFLSHKIFRVLVPFFYALMITAGLLSGSHLIKSLALTIIAATLFAYLLTRIPALKGNRLVRLLSFFFVLNEAAVYGFWYWASGRCTKTWNGKGSPAAATPGNLPKGGA